MEHSSSEESNDVLFHVDVESSGREGEERRAKLLIHLWKVPLPLRKGYPVSDLFKVVACLMTVM